MVCNSVLVLQCWRVPLIPPSTGRSLVRHHSRERNQEQLGRSRKDKVGRGEAAHASQRPSLLFSLPRRFSLCFSAADMIRPLFRLFFFLPFFWYALVLRLEVIGLSLFGLLDFVSLTPLYGKESVSWNWRCFHSKCCFKQLTWKLFVSSVQINGQHLPGSSRVQVSRGYLEWSYRSQPQGCWRTLVPRVPGSLGACLLSFEGDSGIWMEVIAH